MIKKAQLATEYLIGISVLLGIVLPMVYVFYDYSYESVSEASMSQINKISNDILDLCYRVYYQGEPSYLTYSARMPSGIADVQIWGNRELVFFLADGSSLSYWSEVPISAVGAPCEHPCSVQFNRSFYSEGIKRIVIQARDDYAYIFEGPLTHAELVGETLPGQDQFPLFSMDDGYIPMFYDNLLRNSPIYQLGGNLGIGTESPSAGLTVAGDMLISEHLNSGAMIVGGLLSFNTLTADGPLSLGGERIESLPYPEEDHHVATKKFVDDEVQKWIDEND